MADMPPGRVEKTGYASLAWRCFQGEGQLHFAPTRLFLFRLNTLPPHHNIENCRTTHH